MDKRICQEVQVLFLQDDMVGFENRLPFPQVTLYGKRLFSDLVLWGEIWLLDRSKRGTVYGGYVRDGVLFVDHSSRNKFLWNRKHNQQAQTTLRAGKYKVWLDAWLRQGDLCYTDDPAFRNDPFESRDDSPWVPPRKPAYRFWQDIEVIAPDKERDVCQIRLRSQRFHWIYRIARILGVLDELLLAHGHMTEKAARARDWAEMMLRYLEALYNSGNINKIEHYSLFGTGPSRQAVLFHEMQSRLAIVKKGCNQFIDYGTGTTLDCRPERKHINNVAQVLWEILNNENFAADIKTYEPVLAGEHKVYLSRAQGVFNQIPPAFKEDGSVSFEYGYEYALRFTFPWFNKKAGKPYFPQGKPAKTIEYLNSIRRYSISMLNNASVFVIRKGFPGTLRAWNRLQRALEVQELWTELGLREEADSRALEVIREYERAGQFEKAARAEKFRRIALRSRSAKPSTQIEETPRDASKPEKALKVENSHRTYLYGIQMIDISIKIWVAVDAIQEAKEKAGDPETGVKAVLSTADAIGTLVQFGPLQTRFESLARFGKGLNAFNDIGQCIIYGMKVMSAAHEDELLRDYRPEDAETIHAFELIRFFGRGLVGGGSGTSTFAKSPVFAAMQGIGYLLQFVGEVGEAAAKYGAAEAKYFLSAHRNLVEMVNETRIAISDRSWSLDLYSQEEQQLIEKHIQEFEWLPIDPDQFNKFVIHGPEPFPSTPSSTGAR